MSKIAIRADNLSKKYHIGSARKAFDTLGEQLTDLVKTPFRRAGKLLRGHATGAAELDQIIWALSNVSFEVEQGEVVGIIGRNGAGKSTLLKILSRITEPTDGQAELCGRVSSLLEVGTGFHPELTGRENIFLNGAILGMKNLEIESKFDEIVEFAEIGKFIDTPVKHYSSGMHVRLAFAVAAHLEPEILLVDEVLAVGDAAFQKKCLGKMDEVSQAGRTILFVSHNMASIQNLCSRGIWLRDGQVVFDGPIDEAVGNYLSYLSESAENAFGDNPERGGNGSVRLTYANVLNSVGEPTQHVIAGQPVALEFGYENRENLRDSNVVFTIYNHLGVAVTNFNMLLTDYIGELSNQGRFICRIPRLPLPVGQYRVAVSVRVNSNKVVADQIPNVLVFDVASSTFFRSGRTPKINYATVMVEHQWEHVAADPAIQPEMALID